MERDAGALFGEFVAAARFVLVLFAKLVLGLLASSPSEVELFDLGYGTGVDAVVPLALLPLELLPPSSVRSKF
jgi:hypothetical protein